MKHVQRKSFVSLTIALLSLAGALAATHHSPFPSPHINQAVSKNKQSAPAAIERKAIPPALQEPVAPNANPTIDSNVISGGGGTSTGGNFRVDGTIGEVSAT